MISGDRSILQGKKGAFWYTLEEFSKHWDRIDIIVPRPKECQLDVHEPLFENVYFHPSSSSLLHQARWILTKGKRLVGEQKHDVMTVHSYPPFYNDRGARLLAKATGIPYALEVHHIVGEPSPASITEWIGRWQSRLVLPTNARSATAVRTVNRETQQQLSSWGVSADSVHVVPSFYLNRSLIEGVAVSKKTYDLSFAGRLVRNKGIRELVALVCRSQYRLVVVGDGPERCICEQMVKDAGAEDRVHFTGWLPTQEEVLGAIQQAHVFVMNSLSEGGPRIALEAMACGMPVVATPVGVMPDVIDNGVNGMLTTGSQEDLATVLQSLLADPAHCDTLGAAAKRILDLFDRRTLIASYASFLQSLVSSV